MQAYLRVTSGPDAGRTSLIEGIPMVIGRGEKSNTRLTDGTVSRLRCELRWQGINFTLIRSDAEFDTRADIYGLGAPLYVLLTGKAPFEGKNLVETIAPIRQADPVPPKKFPLSVPDPFQDAVMMMMAKRPEKRYQTPTEAARALERIARLQGMAL